MGGKVLEFKNERLLNEGAINELIDLVHEGQITENFASNRASLKYGISKEDFHKKLIEDQTVDDLMQG